MYIIRGCSIEKGPHSTVPSEREGSSVGAGAHSLDAYLQPYADVIKRPRNCMVNGRKPYPVRSEKCELLSDVGHTGNGCAYYTNIRGPLWNYLSLMPLSKRKRTIYSSIRKSIILRCSTVEVESVFRPFQQRWQEGKKLICWNEPQIKQPKLTASMNFPSRVRDAILVLFPLNFEHRRVGYGRWMCDQVKVEREEEIVQVPCSVEKILKDKSEVDFKWRRSI